MAEFEIAGTKYQSRTMDPFVQLRLMKRLAAIAPAIKEIVTAIRVTDVEQELDITTVEFRPLFKAFSEMPDSDLDFIVMACCEVTQRSSGAGWVDVFKDGIFLNRNDQMPATMLLISWHVLRQNFDKFFALARDFGSAA